MSFVAKTFADAAVWLLSHPSIGRRGREIAERSLATIRRDGRPSTEQTLWIDRTLKKRGGAWLAETKQRRRTG